MKESIIWVGMDVHARSVTIAQLAGSEREPVVRELPNDVKKLKAHFEKLSKRGRVQACYEAGVSGFELQRMLSAQGVACEVIAPSLIPARPGERIKNDRVDAIKLVRLYRAGELVPVVVPSEEQEAARDLLRARDDVRRARMAARQQLAKFLLRHGRYFVEGTNWTQKHEAWVRAQHFEVPTLRATFHHYLDHVTYLDQRIEELDGEIAKLAREPMFAETVGRLTCMRAISTLTAMVLATELGDLRRFRHPRQLMAYVGLVPGERSSG
jgi:transposase